MTINLFFIMKFKLKQLKQESHSNFDHKSPSLLPEGKVKAENQRVVKNSYISSLFGSFVLEDLLPVTLCTFFHNFTGYKKTSNSKNVSIIEKFFYFRINKMYENQHKK